MVNSMKGESMMISDTAEIGRGVTIRKGAIIRGKATIGEWARIGRGVTIGRYAVIGEDRKYLQEFIWEA